MNFIYLSLNRYKRMMEEGRKFKLEDEAKEEYNKLHGAENKVIISIKCQENNL